MYVSIFVYVVNLSHFQKNRYFKYFSPWLGQIVGLHFACLKKDSCTKRLLRCKHFNRNIVKENITSMRNISELLPFTGGATVM